MTRQIITQESFASVQEAQAGISKLFKKAKSKKKFIRIMRNQEPLGVLIANDMWISLIEDMEALSSSSYLEAIREARKEKKLISSKEAKKLLKIK